MRMKHKTYRPSPMRLKKSLFFFLISLLGIPVSARAQAWSGILDPSRATDWTQAGIPGGIPNRSVICQNVGPSGKTDATDMNNINSAIASCNGTGAVVQLQSGVYTITGGLSLRTINNVVLRGAGPDKTILKFTGLASCGGGGGSDICVQGSSGWVQNYNSFGGGSTIWTGDNGIAGTYNKGDSVLNVGNWSGRAPSVGDIILVDQRSDSIGICPASGGTGNCSGASGATESSTTVTATTSIPHGYHISDCVGIGGVGGTDSTTGYNSISNTGSCGGYAGWFQITAVPSSTTFQYTAPVSGLGNSGGGLVTADTGGIFVTAVHGATVTQDGTQGRNCPSTVNAPNAACATGEVSNRAQAEIKKITAISGSQITVAPRLEMTNWRTSQSPGIWWAGGVNQQIGIENLTYDMTNDGGGSSNGGIEFYNAYECWVKNVRGIKASRNHVWIQQSARIEVVDSYFAGTKTAGADDYGVEALTASDNVIQNNIGQHVIAGLMVGQDYGSVYAYNYMMDDGYRTPDWMQPMLFQNHDYAGMDLFEGNDTPSTALDAVHGTSAVQTSFRNRLVGQQIPVKTQNLITVQNSAFNRALNFVGNIIGTPTFQTTYQSTAVYPGHTIWNFMPVNSTNTVTDPITISSSLRWGNYDVVTRAVRWCGNSLNPGWTTICNSTSEVPTSGITFVNGNPVPSSLTLPASFYLSGQPSFWVTRWGTPPWPAIGPDVTGGTAPDGVGGYSYSIPAQLCFINTPIDSAYQQTFVVSGASWSSGTATLTIGTNALAAYNTIVVSGINPSGYNGTYEVTGQTSTTISYAVSSNPGSYSSGGTLTYPNILLFNAAYCYLTYGSPAPPTNLMAAPH